MEKIRCGRELGQKKVHGREFVTIPFKHQKRLRMLSAITKVHRYPAVRGSIEGTVTEVFSCIDCLIVPKREGGRNRTG
jgi:hypothetical protein